MFLSFRPSVFSCNPLPWAFILNTPATQSRPLSGAELSVTGADTHGSLTHKIPCKVSSHRLLRPRFSHALMCNVTLQAFDRSSFGVGGGVSSNRFMPSDRVGDPVPSRAPPSGPHGDRNARFNDGPTFAAGPGG